MASSFQPTALQQNLECPICFESYNSRTRVPKALPCGHSICAKCANSIVKDRAIQCPICKKLHQVPRGDVGSLATNFTILSIVDSLCEDCKIYPKVDKCSPQHCNQELCGQCIDKHSIPSSEDCEKAVSDLENEIRRIQKVLLENSELDRMNTEAESITANMDKICKQMHEDIEKAKNRATKEMKKNVQEVTVAHMEWKASIEEKVAQSQIIVKKGRSKQFNATDDKARSEVLRNCIDMSKDLSSTERIKPQTISCKLESNINDVLISIPDLFHVTYTSSTTSLIGRTRMDNPHTTSTKHAFSKTSISTKSSPAMRQQKSNSGMVIHSKDIDLINDPWDISVSPVNGLVVITDFSEKCVYLFTSDYTFITKYSGDMKWPWGVAISRDNKIYISDLNRHDIHVIDTSGRFLSKIGSKGSGPGQFNSPRGLTFDEDNNMFVVDSNNHRIQLLKSDGTYVREFICSGKKLHKYWFIAASKHRDKVIVSDYQGNLHIFTHGGHHQKTLYVDSEPYNMKATGVQIDNSGNVVVLDGKSHRILILNKELQIKSVHGSWGDRAGQLKAPSSLFVHTNRRITVCDNGNKRIQLFQTD